MSESPPSLAKESYHEIIDKLKDLSEFAVSTNDGRFIDVANKLSKDVLLSIAVEEMKNFKAENLLEDAAKKICLELKSAAAANPIAGTAERKFALRGANQIKFFDRAEEMLKADGIDVIQTVESDHITMKISW